ncbi:MAG: class I fructose-bisphosphate aldolase [Anaerolineae bacterium]
MNTGKLVRLNRIFSHPSGRLCSIAVDHFIGYGDGLPRGLRRMQETLAAIVAGQPDAITMHKGIAATMWAPYAGRIPLIIQTIAGRPDDTAYELLVTAEEAIRLGADAVAIAAFVHGKTEGYQLKVVADLVRDAVRFELPVMLHIYPRNPQTLEIIHTPEDIAWAVHCGLELGVDVIKVPYCGDVRAQAEIVSESSVPVVAAGGPRTDTLEAALQMMVEVIASGTRGATIGRNVWGFENQNITAAVQAFKAVIHEGKSAREALNSVGL